jgi:hypothetical protein
MPEQTTTPRGWKTLRRARRKRRFWVVVSCLNSLLICGSGVVDVP